MILQMVGCSHQATSIDLREQLTISSQQLPAALRAFQSRFPEAEAVLLSTCNRLELYTAGTDPAALPSRSEIVQFLADFRGLEREQVSAELLSCSGEEAVRHLFTVAASLDSMVVGEAQILAQVKHAYQLAADRDSAGQLTHAVFQAAIRVAKRVATETSLHQKRVSIPSLAVRDLARQVFERLDDKQILLVGAGEMGEETLQYLIREKALRVTIINRDGEKARQVARKYGQQAAAWEELHKRLITADLVVSATGAREPIVSLESYQQLESQRLQRTLLILDLAVPRDFDPRIGNCLGVYLYSIDDLTEVCERNRRQRECELPRARRIIDDETQRFVRELKHRATGPTIRRLKETAETLKQSELKRLLQRLDELDDRSVQEIQRSFDRLVNKLLHPPLESLREQADSHHHAGLLEALRRLFKLHD